MTGFTFTGDLRGMAALDARLKSLSKDEATKAGQIANRAGAAVIRKQVMKTAPNSPKTSEGEQRTRHNKNGSTRQETHHKIVNSVIVRKTKSGDPTQVHNAVAIKGAYHASFVEFGSIHNTAEPFMMIALIDSQQSVIDVIAKVLNKQLVKRGV